MRLRSNSSFLIVGLFSALALAGCVSEGASESQAAVADSAGPAGFDEDSGAIEGTVTDEEYVPIAGAIVAVAADVEIQAVTAADGSFALSNVPPGKHTLFVQKLGYDAHASHVEVFRGVAARVDIVLDVQPLDEPYAESKNHEGHYGTGFAFVRSTICYGCSNNYFYFGGFVEDMKGMVVEAQWETSDFLGFDLNDRTDSSFMWYRTRSESPVRFFVEPCADYRGEPTYGRSEMPCSPEDLANHEGEDANSAHLETWYVGQFQDETHVADPVCREPVGLPGYEAGCYGVGLAPDLRWSTWVTIFHKELPPDHATFTAFPDA